MKTYILIFLFLPFFAIAQIKKSNDKNAMVPNFNLACSINLLSFADPYLPTIQPGIIFKIAKSVINEFELGIPIHFNNWGFDTLPNFFTHYKIKNSVVWALGKKNIYLGGMIFYTNLDKFSKRGRYKDESGEYDYTSGHWEKKIFGYGFKVDKFIYYSKHLIFELTATIGQRFVNSKITPKTINSNPVLAIDFVNNFEKVGKFTTPHFELGFKTVYKF